MGTPCRKVDEEERVCKDRIIDLRDKELSVTPGEVVRAVDPGELLPELEGPRLNPYIPVGVTNRTEPDKCVRALNGPKVRVIERVGHVPPSLVESNLDDPTDPLLTAEDIVRTTGTRDEGLDGHRISFRGRNHFPSPTDEGNISGRRGKGRKK
jgi:hypothetical protein